MLHNSSATPISSTSPQRHSKVYIQKEIDAEEQNMIRTFLQDRSVEVVVILEGTDAATGAPFQARHSYTYDECLWDSCFVHCVSCVL